MKIGTIVKRASRYGWCICQRYGTCWCKRAGTTFRVVDVRDDMPCQSGVMVSVDAGGKVLGLMDSAYYEIA